MARIFGRFPRVVGSSLDFSPLDTYNTYIVMHIMRINEGNPMARLNITIPDALYARLEQLRDRINLSKICAIALEKEVKMLEGHPNITDPRIAHILKRLQGTRERWYQRGREDGIPWAMESATRKELWTVATQLADKNGLELLNELRRNNLIRRHVDTIRRHADTNDMMQFAFPISFDVETRIQYWQQQELQEESEGLSAPAEVDETAYLEGWRDSIVEIWQAIAPGF